MAIKVRGEVIVPATEECFCMEIREVYTHPSKLRRERHSVKMCDNDFADGHTVAVSEDNGRTWGPEKDVYGEQVIFAPDGAWELIRPSAIADIWNPVHGHYVGMGMEMIYRGGHKAAHAAFWRGENSGCSYHSYLNVRGEEESAPSQTLIKYEDGPDFDPADPLKEDYFYRNYAYFSKPWIAKNGDILFTVGASVTACCRILGIDPQGISPTKPDLINGLLVGRGVWNGDSYELSFSRPVVISDLLSSRGIDEPMVAELESGRILVVFRGSNQKLRFSRIEPGAPGFKWYCYSDDGGRTFTDPMPWRFDDGEVIYSPAAISYFIRSRKNGRLHWIGNITGHNVDGNWPRYPLQIVEVDETYGTAKKESLTVIDTKRDWESPDLQLSNFQLLEDRESGDIELWLAKIGQYGSEDWIRGETWKYRICID